MSLGACLFVLLALMMYTASSDECRTIIVTGALNLQEVVDRLAADEEVTANCSIIELPPGEHVLSSQTMFPSELGSLELRGPREGIASVGCRYDVETNYTWYFSEILSLKIHNVHFHDCPRPLRIDTVEEVELNDCSFRYFTEAVLDIFNCHHTRLRSVTLEHNKGSGISGISYRGNTGGASFGYNNLPQRFSTPSLNISDSTFLNNSARANSVFLTSSQAFFRRVFTGRGGAMGVFVNESHYGIDVALSNCVFEDNYARSFGGGVYILPGGRRGTSHKVLVEGCRFVGNEAGISGGGVQVTYPTAGPRNNPHLVTFVDCSVTNNTAPFNGGGMYISSITLGVGNSVDIKSSNYTGNNATYGGALVLKSFAFSIDSSSLASHQVTDCTFSRNSGVIGVVSVWFVSAHFRGTNNLTGNYGNALQVISSVVHLSGQMYFLNNSGEDDSAFHLRSFSQAVLGAGLLINFEGNSGRFGAGMYVENQYDSPVVESNPSACFLRHEEYKAPAEWDDITVRFSENKAILASNMYMSRLDWQTCSSPFLYTFRFLRNNGDILDWPIWELGDSNVNTGYSDSTLPHLTVQTTVKTLTTPNTTVKAWPGLKYIIEMVGIDEYNTATTALARLYFKPNSESQGMNIRFHPEVIIVGPDPTSGLLTKHFTIIHGIQNVSSKSIAGPLGEVVLQALDTTTIEVESASFVLEGQLCPAGYRLFTDSAQSSTCICNEDIPEVLLCEDDQKTVVIKRGKWGVYVPTNVENNMQFFVCPAGYCSCKHDAMISNETCIYSYVHSNPDLQCSCGRTGVLCGECKSEGEGVSALLSECVSCSNISALFILALVLADIAVLLVLAVFNIPLPSWTIPFVFYIQLAPIVALYFPPSFIQVGKYLYYIASASGFYFVYDFCLYGGLSPEMAYFIRYLPLLLALLTCIPVLLFGSSRVVSKHRPPSSHGVWFVVVLIYTHAVHTSLTVLHCQYITDSQGDSSYRWFVNGNRECFTGGHILLGLVSIVVLLAAGALIPLCFILSISHPDKFPKSLRLLRESLMEHYRQSCRWWAAVDLARRFLFLLLVVLLPRNQVVPVLLLALYTTVYTYIQPYKLKFTNVIESAIDINFLLLLFLNTTVFFREDYLTFPALTETQFSNTTTSCSQNVRGVATVSWILMPFYYFPLAILGVILGVKSFVYIRRKAGEYSSREVEEETTLVNGADGADGGSSVEYTKWDIELSPDGFLHLQSQSQEDS